jgi:hypothetical protein
VPPSAAGGPGRAWPPRAGALRGRPFWRTVTARHRATYPRGVRTYSRGAAGSGSGGRTCRPSPRFRCRGVAVRIEAGSREGFSRSSDRARISGRPRARPGGAGVREGRDRAGSLPRPVYPEGRPAAGCGWSGCGSGPGSRPHPVPRRDRRRSMSQGDRPREGGCRGHRDRRLPRTDQATGAPRARRRCRYPLSNPGPSPRSARHGARSAEGRFLET